MWETGFWIVGVRLGYRLLSEKGETSWLKELKDMGDRECFGILRFAQDDNKNKRW